MAAAPSKRRTASARPAVRAELPIGVFDSGVGGLTVLKAIAERMPRESLLYLGDTARLPYGSKSPETVTGYAIEAADFFVERGVKLLVVACNTMSAVALEVLRARYDVPVIGVIDPGARAALRATKRGRIGVIATEATIASGAYTRELRRSGADVEIFSRACPLFVHLVEEGWVDNEVARRAIAIYLASLKKSGIDTLILGCTHYPLLRRPIGDFMGQGVRLVDSAEETALAVRRICGQLSLARRRGTGSASFFVTDVAERFMRCGERCYGSSVASAVRVLLRSDRPPKRRRSLEA